MFAIALGIISIFISISFIVLFLYMFMFIFFFFLSNKFFKAKPISNECIKKIKETKNLIVISSESFLSYYGEAFFIGFIN
jgi:hypothetical protein